MKAKAPTALQRKIWGLLAALGCIVRDCGGPANIHHIETGGGGRKDHDRVIPLCYFHHQGEGGIHTIGRRIWQAMHGTEQELLQLAMERINEE